MCSSRSENLIKIYFLFICKILNKIGLNSFLCLFWLALVLATIRCWLVFVFCALVKPFFNRSQFARDSVQNWYWPPLGLGLHLNSTGRLGLDSMYSMLCTVFLTRTLKSYQFIDWQPLYSSLRHLSSFQWLIIRLLLVLKSPWNWTQTSII